MDESLMEGEVPLEDALEKITPQNLVSKQLEKWKK